MRKLIMLVCALVMVGVLVNAQEDTNGLPPAARIELQKMEKAIKDIKKATAVNLEKILKTEIQKGNLKGAVAIDKQIVTLRDSSWIIGEWSVNYENGAHRIYIITRSDLKTFDDKGNFWVGSYALSEDGSTFVIQDGLNKVEEWKINKNVVSVNHYFTKAAFLERVVSTKGKAEKK